MRIAARVASRYRHQPPRYAMRGGCVIVRKKPPAQPVEGDGKL